MNLLSPIELKPPCNKDNKQLIWRRSFRRALFYEFNLPESYWILSHETHFFCNFSGWCLFNKFWSWFRIIFSFRIGFYFEVSSFISHDWLRQVQATLVTDAYFEVCAAQEATKIGRNIYLLLDAVSPCKDLFYCYSQVWEMGDGRCIFKVKPNSGRK